MQRPPVNAPVAVVSRYVPDPGGPAGSRLVHAFAEGAHQLGREVSVWSWWPFDEPSSLPPWARWEPLPTRSLLRVKGRALLRPRGDVATHDWELPEQAVLLAEDVLSAPAVAGRPWSAVTVHYLTALDRRALGGLRLRDVQDVRSQRVAARAVACPTAYSHRVAATLGRGVATVPAAIDLPTQPLPPVEEPVAACIADWSWPPNRLALGRLLAAWPLVRARLPAARLVLAGYGDPQVGTVPGVRVLGRVPDTTAVLADAAALVFPCPPTSGPKVKVMEAMSLGVPVVTTTAGAEGLQVQTDAYELVTDTAPEPLAAAVVRVLGDAAARTEMGLRGRAQLAAAHAPVPAARARLAVIDAALAAQ